MKNLSRLVLVALLVLVTVNVNAQDKNNPWQITVGVNAVDALATVEVPYVVGSITNPTSLKSFAVDTSSPSSCVRVVAVIT
jgi:uncharacterized alpha-E superfamily protein